jgi:ankyrin repeat protein
VLGIQCGEVKKKINLESYPRSNIEAGARLNQVNADGETAIIAAAKRGYARIVRILLRGRLMRGAVTGYAYNAPSGDGVVDITFVGYVTPTSNGGPLRRTTIFDATSTSCDTSAAPGGATYQGCAIYHGSDSALYLRFKPSSLYHIAFSVDSMYVGNGYVLKRNDIEVVVDPSASL